jgi:hypothetical protein
MRTELRAPQSVCGQGSPLPRLTGTLTVATSQGLGIDPDWILLPVEFKFVPQQDDGLDVPENT